MIRNTFFALMAVLATAFSAQAGVMIESDGGVVTPGLSGYTTYSLTAVSDVEGELISVIDFIGDKDNTDPETARGFFGDLNQLEAGGPGTTVFNNFNFAFAEPLQDSQFRESSNNVIVAAQFEDTGALRAAYSYADPSQLSLPLAQLTIPDAAAGTVNYRGVVSVVRGGTIVDLPEITGCIGVCGTVELPMVGDLSLETTTLNEMLSDAVAVSNVDALGFDDVNNPTFTPLLDGKPLTLPNLPTLDAAGNFSWDTKGALRGLYEWPITGTRGTDSDDGLISVRVTQVPEPATLSLFGLALVGLVGIGRKRS